MLQVDAMRREATASAEAIAANRAAKSAADTEAAELEKLLNETMTVLEEQQASSKRLELAAQRTQDQLDSALETRVDLVLKNQSLTQVGKYNEAAWT